MARREVNVGQAERKEVIYATVDKTDEQILALIQDDGVELDFDYRSFRKLPESIVGKFDMETLKRYWIAESKAKDYAERAAGEVKIIENPLGSSQSAFEHRLRIRTRKGWHGYWANPGADFDRCMASGMYKQVRRPTEEQEKKGFEVGEENGEVVKRLNAEGKVEAIALECREEHYQQYLQWMDQQSSLRYGAIKENYMTNVDGINRDIKDRSARIRPLDLNEGGDGYERLHSEHWCV